MTITDPELLQKASENILMKSRLIEENAADFALGLVNFKLGSYDFDYKTPEEIVATQTGTLPREIPASATSQTLRRKRQAFMSATTCTTAPTFKDWVAEGKVTSPVSQGQCNSCYIFAAVASLESQIAIRDGTAPLKISEQTLVECVRNPVQPSPYGGCNFGRAEWAWNYTKYDNGPSKSVDYNPYNASDVGSCKKNLAKIPNSVVTSWIRLPYADEETLKCSLLMNGPHAISMDFSGSIANYLSGVFDDPNTECNSTRVIINNMWTMVKPYNHAVTLVGELKGIINFTN